MCSSDLFPSHDKSWKLGRSDFQRAAGGSSSYVASYVNSLCSAPLLYRSCRAFKPRSRASLGFFEKGCAFDQDDDSYAQIEQKIDSVVNGRVYNFNGLSIRSTPPMSYIRTLLPRFSSARNDDSIAIARVLRAVHSTPKRIAKYGFIDYKQDSILSLVRTYYQYLKVNPILTDDDKIILHSSRCLTRFCNSSSDVDIESYINKLYQQEKLPSGMDRSYAKVPSQLVSVNKSGVKLLWKVVRGNSDLKALNRGRLRHPLFGNRKHWYEQSIPPGMWDDAILKVAPTVIGDTADVLEAFVEKEVMRG